jgi:hypothetical protein
MTEAPAESQAPATETGEQEASKPKPTETVEFWKQKAREQEQRAKANAEAAQKLQQFEEATKTEAQKLAERADGAESRATATEAQLHRLEVILEKIPDDATMADARKLVALSKRLVGTSREELAADADELLSTFTFKPATAEEAVVTSLDLGARSGGTPLPLNGDPLEKALRAKLGIS